jgi:hypothetical protein
MNLKDHREISPHGLELMRARTELAFLLSDQVCTPAGEVLKARERIDELLNRIPHGWQLRFKQMARLCGHEHREVGFRWTHLWQRAPFYTTTQP